MVKVLVDELAGVRLCGFALAFDWHAKASTFVFNANVRTASRRLPARCCRSPCCSQVRDQLIQAMRNSDT